MKELDLIFSIIGTVFTLLISILTLIIKYNKNLKAKKIAQDLLNLTNEVIPLIEEAETFVNYTGKEKKSYVETRIIKKEELKNLSDEIVSSTIDNLVTLTKNVNVKSNNYINEKCLKRISNGENNG